MKVILGAENISPLTSRNKFGTGSEGGIIIFEK